MNNSHWQETKEGWVTEASTLSCEGQEFMPRGESYYDTKKFKERWRVDRDRENEILAWIYTYPDGKKAIVLND